MLYKTFATFCCCCILQAFAKQAHFIPLPITIYLKEPSYSHGVMTTSQGGIISSEGFRLQARNITYTKTTDEHQDINKVSAHGDLMVDYHGQILLGDSLEYDFVTQQGVLINGRTSVGIWFISGKKILLHANHSLQVTEVSLTTTEEEGQATFTMTAESITLTKDRYLSTKNIQIRYRNTPIFWIPHFHTDLQKKTDSPMTYGLTWDAGQGPKFSMRYRVYSKNAFNVYLRGDYHWGKGPGGALEMDYLSEDKITLFQSKNYIAHDTFYNDDNPNKRKTRFRLQGLYSTHTHDEKGNVFLCYDKLSDKNMPQDFKSDDFELNTAQQTKLISRYISNHWIAGFNIQPRINNFQGFKQELPQFNLSFKPIQLGSSPLIFSNKFHLAYLDYVYSSDIAGAPPNIAGVLKDFHAVRGETHQELTCPLHYKGIDLTPNAGFIGIAYNNSPNRSSVNQVIWKYGADLNVHFTKTFSSYKHELIPYANYVGLHKPLTQEVYIFDIHDGYYRLNMVTLGCNNLLYLKNTPLPTLTLDLYALGFLGNQTFHLPFPKAGFNLLWTRPNLKLGTDVRWNFNNHVLDFANCNLYYTFNTNLAFYLEYRHRSRFDWRKDQHNNFILDAARQISTLLDSPLSDGRNTFLARAELKLSPKWTCQIQMHNGWGRSNQPGYTEAKVDLSTLLASAWKLKISYTHTTRGKNHLGISISLVQ